MRSRINDGPEKVFRVGESFVEMPGDHHGVSANASDVEPSKLLAVFVVDTADRVLTTTGPALAAAAARELSCSRPQG